VEVHLAADAPGQEGILPAIFAVAHDRVADRGHVDAQLMGAAGIRLEFDPRRRIAGALDHPIARARGAAFLLVDMHLLAAGAGLLGDRQLDHAVVDRRHARHQRPIHLARGAAGEGLGEMRRRVGRARDQQHARRILVEPVDQFWPALRLELDAIEQTIDMALGLGAALRREAGILVEHDRGTIAVDHHLLDILLVLRAQRRTLLLGLRLPGGGGRLQRGDADRLACLDPVAGRDALAVDAKLARARPARDDVEARIRDVALEPAIEPDAVVVVGHDEGLCVGDGVAHAKALTMKRPMNSISTEPATEDTP
jgi:hypothetical protein